NIHIVLMGLHVVVIDILFLHDALPIWLPGGLRPQRRVVLDEDGAEEVEQLVLAEDAGVAGAEAALAVHHHRRREQLDVAVEAGDGPGGVGDDGVGREGVLGGPRLQRRQRVVVLGDAYDDEALAGERLVEPGEGVHPFEAELVPRRPEVEDDDVPALLGEGEVAAGAGEREVRRGGGVERPVGDGGGDGGGFGRRAGGGARRGRGRDGLLGLAAGGGEGPEREEEGAVAEAHGTETQATRRAASRRRSAWMAAWFRQRTTAPRWIT